MKLKDVMILASKKSGDIIMLNNLTRPSSKVYLPGMATPQRKIKREKTISK